MQSVKQLKRNRLSPVTLFPIAFRHLVERNDSLIVIRGIGCGLLLILVLIDSTLAQNELGMVSEKPKSGPFVKTGNGFMVPYQAKIPGTTATYEMVPVRGGMFQMTFPGTNGLKPEHRVVVTIQPYWVGKSEVTWEEYDGYCRLNRIFRNFERKGIRRVLEKNRVDAVTAPSLLYDPPNYFPLGDKRNWAKYPAAGMTQYAAKQYTKWISKLTGRFYRLPTEVEWEYACRAGQPGPYGFVGPKAKLGDYAWYSDNSDGDYHPVRSKLPNAWGLYDMHGNVAEWVLDAYTKDYSQLKREVEAEITLNWPKKLHPRTVRGGSWDSDAKDVQSDSRMGSSVDWQDEDPNIPLSPTWLASSDTQRQIGFRIVRPLNRPKNENRFWNADVDELKKAIKVFTTNGHSSQGLVDRELPQAVKDMEGVKK